MPRLLYPQNNSSRYPLDRRLDAGWGVDKSLPLPGIETRTYSRYGDMSFSAETPRVTTVNCNEVMKDDTFTDLTSRPEEPMFLNEISRE